MASTAVSSKRRGSRSTPQFGTTGFLKDQAKPKKKQKQANWVAKTTALVSTPESGTVRRGNETFAKKPPLWVSRPAVFLKTIAKKVTMMYPPLTKQKVRSPLAGS